MDIKNTVENISTDLYHLTATSSTQIKHTALQAIATMKKLTEQLTDTEKEKEHYKYILIRVINDDGIPADRRYDLICEVCKDYTPEELNIAIRIAQNFPTLDMNTFRKLHFRK